MVTNAKPFLALLASDVMSRDVLLLPENMSLREAARLLLRNRVSGAPVVNATGKCVGILSTTDFLRLAGRGDEAPGSTSGQPLTCSHLEKHPMSDGREVFLCLLPEGTCPLQHREHDPESGEVLACTQPHCILLDWQMVPEEKWPGDTVAAFMTTHLVTASPTVPIRDLARQMLHAHIHRVIVVDERQRPIGIVASTDVLAAVACAGEG